MKKYQIDDQMIDDIQQDTERIEKKYQRQQRQKKQKQKEKEDLSQQWLAPILFFAILLIASLLYFLY